tara:strand:- start:45 stop:206 length:162 start_codon:yes stop_codon:yes gene_type:complete
MDEDRLNWPNWLNWIEHQTSNLGVAGSSPALGGMDLEWVRNGFAYKKLPNMLA